MTDDGLSVIVRRVHLPTIHTKQTGVVVFAALLTLVLWWNNFKELVIYLIENHYISQDFTKMVGEPERSNLYFGIFFLS